MTKPAVITIGEGPVPLSVLRRAAAGPATVRLTATAENAVAAGAAAVDRIVAEGRPAYGINTGFGYLAQTRIETAALAQLQHNLVLSHAAGTGDLLDDDIVRLILVLKIVSLARGHSGVRRETVAALARLLEKEVYPCVPAQGSVGASGDLAPLAHLAAVLIGTGEARVEGKIVPATEGLAKAGLKPLMLGPKEGLALLNGTQVSTALALTNLIRIEHLFGAALVTGALSVDAIKGSDTPFDARIHAVRGHAGQSAVAAILRGFLAGSAIRDSHRDCPRVQDPYSIRCQPQVMGAVLAAIAHARDTLAVEANGVSDNPLIFAETGEVLSGGNFHAEPVAIAADMLAIATAEIGSLAERRIALLTDPNLSGLPAFLVREPGLNSGYMITQVTAAALASENKGLAVPVATESLPTSANQEDHVSMATYAARRLGAMAENLSGILAIELLCACQAIDFHAPLTTSPALQEVHGALRALVPHYDSDRFMAPDIAAAKKLVSGPVIAEFLARHVKTWPDQIVTATD